MQTSEEILLWLALSCVLWALVVKFILWMVS
jgi:hypothetical protein